MDRRRYCKWLTSAAVAGLAGCSGPPSAEVDGGVTPVDLVNNTPSTPEPAAGDIEHPVPNHHLEIAGYKDSIPAITDPAFSHDWSDVRLRLQQQAISPEFEFEFEPRLSASSPVIGVERHHIARLPARHPELVRGR